MIFADTRRIIDAHQFSVRKKYGQNFLIDGNILQGIVEKAGVGGDDVVLEIGPGIGSLTEFLAKKASHVIAVEIDRKLIPILGETLSPYPNTEIVHADILKTDIDSLFAPYAGCSKKVIANLPYYITTPVLMELLTAKTEFELMFFMVQKEVAERLCSQAGDPSYGAVTLAAAYYADLSFEGTVPPSCFFPRPQVESALLALRPKKEKIPVKDEALLFALIRAAFNQRRKTLVNAASHFEGLACTKEEITAALGQCGLPETVRGEALGLEAFAALADALYNDGVHAGNTTEEEACK